MSDSLVDGMTAGFRQCTFSINLGLIPLQYVRCFVIQEVDPI